MADHAAAAGFLAFLAVALAAWLAVRAVRRAPRTEPLRARLSVAPAAQGPVQTLLVAAASMGPGGLAAQIEGPARDVLREWLSERGVPPGEAVERARSGRLRIHPVLVHLLEARSYDEWWRDEARARWRGPGFLFHPWYALVAWSDSHEARCVRYLDLMSRKLEETVRSA